MATTAVLPSSITKFGAHTPDAALQFPAAYYMTLRADVTLTSAQILALQSGAITLIPAPGAGLMIIPESIVIRLLGGTAYTDAGGAVSFNVGTMTAALAANTVFTGPTAGQRSQQLFSFAGTSTAAAPPTNENAAMTISKATNNFAAGTGTAHLTIFYSVESAT